MFVCKIMIFPKTLSFWKNMFFMEKTCFSPDCFFRQKPILEGVWQYKDHFKYQVLVAAYDGDDDFKKYHVFRWKLHFKLFQAFSYV